MQPFGILHICDVWYISRRNAICFLREKRHLHGLFLPELTSFKAMQMSFRLFQVTKMT